MKGDDNDAGREDEDEGWQWVKLPETITNLGRNLLIAETTFRRQSVSGSLLTLRLVVELGKDDDIVTSLIIDVSTVVVVAIVAAAWYPNKGSVI